MRTIFANDVHAQQHSFAQWRSAAKHERRVGREIFGGEFREKPQPSRVDADDGFHAIDQATRLPYQRSVAADDDGDVKLRRVGQVVIVGLNIDDRGMTRHDGAHHLSGMRRFILDAIDDEQCAQCHGVLSKSPSVKISSTNAV